MSMYHVVAKDFHSPLFRNEIWTNSLYLWPTMFNIPRAYVGIESVKNTIGYFIDLESFGRSREVFQKQIEEDRNLLKKVIDLSEAYGQEMNAYTETVFTADLSKWSDKQLTESYEKFCGLQSRQYAVGILLPLIDLTGVSYVEMHVKRILAKYLNEIDAASAFTVFTTPTKNSFSLDQEEDLLCVAQKVAEDPSMRTDLLAQHTTKHAWVYYVYQGPAFTEQQFGEFLDEYTVKGINPRVELERRTEDRKRLFAERDRLLSSLPLNDDERNILLIASEFVWSKPRRKDYQSKSYYHMEAFFREFARRTGTSLRHARAATQNQIAQGLLSHTVDQLQLEQQFAYHLVTHGENKAVVLSGAEADAFAKNIVREEAIVGDVQELHGSTAFPGNARGTVKIVNTPEDMGKMQQGDILVAVATTPSCVPAMKKAAAIVSDEGGLTCHAAIVSRELRVPCVVGTKIATSVLKDGDEVEVDAEKGIVRILK